MREAFQGVGKEVRIQHVWREHVQ